MTLCLVLSYSFWNAEVKDRAEYRPIECTDGLPMGWFQTESCRFLVAARSSSVCYPHTLNHAAFGRKLRHAGCTHVVSSSVCGSLDPSVPVPSIVIPDQFIDLHRVAPDVPDDGDEVRFPDFSFPFCRGLRLLTVSSLSSQSQYRVIPAGCYVGVDGPRSETAAEARAYRQWGGDVVGMTAVREAIAYRNAGLCFATIALVTRPGAGLGCDRDLFLNCGSYIAAQMGELECNCQNSN